MNDLLLKPITEMAPEEINFLYTQITHAQLTSLSNQVQLLAAGIETVANDQKKQNARIDIIFEEQKEQKESIKSLKDTLNILCSRVHAAKLDKLRRIASGRVKELLGGVNTDEYKLFSPFFYKGIYASLKYAFNIDGSYLNMDMTNCDQPGSLYQRALEYLTYWKPSRRYFDKCYCNLKTDYLNETLRPERVMAFTRFQIATHDGKNVEFVRG